MGRSCLPAHRRDDSTPQNDSTAEKSFENVLEPDMFDEEVSRFSQLRNSHHREEFEVVAASGLNQC